MVKSGSKSSSPVEPGQILCVVANSSNDDSVSSLDDSSYLSFGEDPSSDSDHEHAKKPKRRTKSRSQDTARISPLRHMHYPRERCHSTPDIGTSVHPSTSNYRLNHDNGKSPSASRWDMDPVISCKSSPGKPIRRRNYATKKERPTIVVNTKIKKENDDDDDGDDHSLNADDHSAKTEDSLKLNSLLEDIPNKLDRWCADSSQHLLASRQGPNMNMSCHIGGGGGGSLLLGEISSGRWQDSVGDSGHESSCPSSRWSASFTSSLLDQISTRPRLPRRKQSGRLVKHTTPVTASTSTETSLAVSSTGNATVGSSEIEELSTDMVATASTIVIDCSLLKNAVASAETAAPHGGLSGAEGYGSANASSCSGSSKTATGTAGSAATAIPTVIAAKKPRPQLPHRQKSFGRGMSIGMAAKAIAANVDGNTKTGSIRIPASLMMVKQESEPSLAAAAAKEGLAIDLSAPKIDELANGNSSCRRTWEFKFRRQNSMPLPLRNMPHGLCKREESDETPSQANLSSMDISSGTCDSHVSARSNQSDRSSLVKQRSLSYLPLGCSGQNYGIPQRPERQASLSSLVVSNHSEGTVHSDRVHRFHQHMSLTRNTFHGGSSRMELGQQWQAQRPNHHHGDFPQLPPREPSEMSPIMAGCNKRPLVVSSLEQQGDNFSTMIPAPPSLPQRHVSGETTTDATWMSNTLHRCNIRQVTMKAALLSEVPSSTTSTRTTNNIRRRLPLTKFQSDPTVLSLMSSSRAQREQRHSDFLSPNRQTSLLGSDDKLDDDDYLGHAHSLRAIVLQERRRHRSV